MEQVEIYSCSHVPSYLQTTPLTSWKASWLAVTLARVGSPRAKLRRRGVGREVRNKGTQGRQVPSSHTEGTPLV